MDFQARRDDIEDLDPTESFVAFKKKKKHTQAKPAGAPNEETETAEGADSDSDSEVYAAAKGEIQYHEPPTLQHNPLPHFTITITTSARFNMNGRMQSLH